MPDILHLWLFRWVCIGERFSRHLKPFRGTGQHAGAIARTGAGHDYLVAQRDQVFQFGAQDKVQFQPIGGQASGVCRICSKLGAIDGTPV